MSNMVRRTPPAPPSARSKASAPAFRDNAKEDAGPGRRFVALRLQAPPPANDGQVGKIINEFQSDTAAIVGETDPFAARATTYLLIFGFIIGLAWAAWAELDRIVISRGTIVSTEPSVLVQPYETSIIRSLTVREGDTVSAGQVLATLDPTFTAADVAQLESRLRSLDASIARLEAERDGKPYAAVEGVVNSEVQALQFSLYQQRKREFEASMRSRDEQLSRLLAQKQGREQQIQNLKTQRALIDEIEDMRRRLLAAETGSRLNLLYAQRDAITIAREINSGEAELIQLEHQIQAARAEVEVYTKQWANNISNDLMRLGDERSSLTEQLNKARKKFNLIELKTPVDAVVLEVAKRSVGSIVSGAETLVRLIPLNAPLEVSGSISAREMGFIKVGDKVSIKLDAYTFTEFGMMEGVVHTISEDAFREGPASASIYRTRIKITANNMRNLPAAFRLIPGMPLSAEIKVGKRSVLGYFLRPVLRGLEEGLREP